MKRPYAQKRMIVTEAMVYRDLVWAPPLGWNTRMQLRIKGHTGKYMTVYKRTDYGWLTGGRQIRD